MSSYLLLQDIRKPNNCPSYGGNSFIFQGPLLTFLIFLFSFGELNSNIMTVVDNMMVGGECTRQTVHVHREAQQRHPLPSRCNDTRPARWRVLHMSMQKKELEWVKIKHETRIYEKKIQSILNWAGRGLDMTINNTDQSSPEQPSQTKLILS